MPNIIVELNAEIQRVTALLPTFDDVHRIGVQNAITFARQNMALNNFEGMQESLGDLREIGQSQAPERLEGNEK